MKNTTSKNINWPTTSYFTIRDVQELNKGVVNITLRVRMTKCKENNEIAEIGYIPAPKGRPNKIFALTPITSELLDGAEKNGVMLIDKAREKLVKVLDIRNGNNTVNVEDTITENELEEEMKEEFSS